MNSYKNVDVCRCCGSNNLKCVLDLNNQPLANSYHNNKEILEEYPLKLNLCEECFNCQLSVVVDPSLMFKNYLYVSGTTDTLKEYFDFFAKFTLQRYKYLNNSSAKKILDIACNDGTQLDYYKSMGLKTVGIDPAENLYPKSSKKHDIICDFFPTQISEKFDIIIAQNVFAHTHEINKFLISCGDILENGGVIYIQTSQSNMIKNNEFDTIYHEHLSFFNTLSMKKIVESCGLVLNNVFKFDIHGSSYVFEVGKTTKDSNIDSVLKIERKEGLYSIETYLNFAKNAVEITNNLKNVVKKYKEEGYLVVGYGAAAKGMTLLNFGKIQLDFIIDDNPMKNGLYTPGLNIPIHSIKILDSLTKEKIVFVPLAWNFFDEIKNRIEKVRKLKNDVFVKYFPSIDINET